MTHFDSATLHRVCSGKTGHYLAGREYLNLKLVVSRFRYRFRKNL